MNTIPLPENVLRTDAYKQYSKGIISGEECNKKLKLLGFKIGVTIEYNDKGQDIVTGFSKS